MKYTTTEKELNLSIEWFQKYDSNTYKYLWMYSSGGGRNWIISDYGNDEDDLLERVRNLKNKNSQLLFDTETKEILFERIETCSYCEFCKK